MVVKVSKPEINVREKISELDKPSGVAGQAMLAAETPQEQFNLIGAGRRNILINGDFQVSQRGDFTTAADAGNAYYLDRWVVDRNGTCDLQHTTGHDIPGSPAICKAGKLTQTVAGNNYLGFRQKIEDPTRYVGRTITYSAWIRSNTSNARIEWYTQGTNQFAIGPNHSGSGEWEYLSFTTVMTGNPSSAWWVDVFIDNGSYSNVQINVGDFVEVTMAQLEIGPVATPFEHRSYGEELALCQRYFQQVTNFSTFANKTADNNYDGHVLLPALQLIPEMRSKPAFTITSSSGRLANSAGFNNPVSGRSALSWDSALSSKNALALTGYWQWTGDSQSQNTIAVKFSATMDAEL